MVEYLDRITPGIDADVAKEFQKVLTDTGSDYVGDTPEHFAAFVKAEAAKWGRVAKETGATLD